MTITLALLFGAIIGVLLGLLGGGGSILAVPALVYAVGLDMDQAIPVSLIVIGVASAVGALPKIRAGHVQWRLAAIFAAAGIPATFAGAAAAALCLGGRGGDLRASFPAAGDDLLARHDAGLRRARPAAGGTLAEDRGDFRHVAFECLRDGPFHESNVGVRLVWAGECCHVDGYAGPSVGAAEKCVSERPLRSGPGASPAADTSAPPRRSEPESRGHPLGALGAAGRCIPRRSVRYVTRSAPAHRIPILVGCHSARALRHAGSVGDGWVAPQSVDELNPTRLR